MPASKPVIVLVPGAWTPPTAYHKLVNILRSTPYNYTVHSPSLASNNGAVAPNTFESDVEVVRSAVEPLVSAGEEVVLVMHSYGGVVGSSAASKDLTSKDRQAAGLPGGIAHLFYISAYLLARDQSAWDVLVEAGGDTPERRALVEFKDDGTWMPTDAVSGLYHDLDPEDQEGQAGGLRPHNCVALMGKATHEPWRDVPCTYVYSSEDRWVPPSFQDICLNNARKAGRNVDVHKFPCAHAAYANHRREVAELIDRTAAPRTSV